MLTVVGWPRSGTHWLKAMLEEALGEELVHDHSCPDVADGQYVLIVRDPRDAFASHWRLYQEENPGESTELGFVDLLMRGQMQSHRNWNIGWVLHTKRLLAWNAQHPHLAPLVRYEQMYTHPRLTLASVLETMGQEVPFSRIREAVQRTRDRCDPSDLGIEEDMGRPGKWKAQLQDATVCALLESCGDLMAEMGYLMQKPRLSPPSNVNWNGLKEREPNV